MKYKLFERMIVGAGLPEPEREYKFHSVRRWRADFCWPLPIGLVVEIEGGVWTRGRHTRGSGFVKDMEKYNAATMMGYTILRFTPYEANSGVAVKDIVAWFKMKGIKTGEREE